LTPPGITAVARSKSRRDAALPTTGGCEVLDVLATTVSLTSGVARGQRRGLAK